MALPATAASRQQSCWPMREYLADDENVLDSDDKDNIPTLRSVYSDTFDVSVLTVFSSEVESLKQGTINT